MAEQKGRMWDLLREASKAFEDSRSPFEADWLVEHDVKADECFQLSQTISAAIDYFVLMVDAGAAKRESITALRELATRKVT